jgi:eukaryotic-like serine/threonine-protein kinase
VTFGGTERYAVERELGAGGFGVVYLAYDNVRHERVALKVLRQVDPGRLYAFKREFRALADVAHPNLVSLYELVSAERDWFFTMELVEGQTLLEYVGGSWAPREANNSGATLLLAGQRALAQLEQDLPVVRPSAPPPAAFDEARLRGAFAQLAEGVVALHASGHLHRDLKPQNALVTRGGRVVLLDFGLVKELGTDGSMDQRVVGTVSYMSPEQGMGHKLTPASDWYALGVMLYRSLTGRLPHIGDLYAVLVAKRSIDPLPPSSLARVPRDLDELCMALLARDPATRPGAEEILRRLGAPTAIAVESSRPSSTELALVGRERELGELTAAYEDSKRGQLACVLCGGASGMGKTALLAELARRMRVDEGAVLLRGSCYERESVPYKALDSLLDALSSHLRKLPRLRAEQLLPREVRALTRLFPVLERVDAVAAFPRRAGEQAEPEEVRRRAIVALRELLGRMRDHGPLVLAIDDGHWGDADSSRLLRDLLAEDCPPLLLLVSHRTPDEGPFVGELATALRRSGVLIRELELGPLAQEDAEQLALSLLDAPDGELARAVAREAGGVPWFIAELSHQLREGAVLGSSGVDLVEVLRRRVRALEAGPRALLEVVAVAGRPLPEAVALRAAAPLDDGRVALVELRRGRMLRTSLVDGATLLAPHHDRLTALALEGADERHVSALHLRLAEALEAEESADAEALAVHFRAAGDDARAGRYARVAGEQALHAFAFARAAHLFTQALTAAPARGEERARLLEQLAEALGHAGRGPEAADAYLDAAVSDPRRAVLLRCRAAEQLFFCGHIDRGTSIMREVLEAARLPPLPASETLAIFGFVRRRIELRLRGLSFKLREPGRIDPAELVRTDVCYSVAAVLGGIRPLTATTMQTHHLLMTLELGEPYRLVRGLGLEAIFSSMGGSADARRTADLLDQAAELAARSDEQQARAVATACAGIAAYFEGEFRRSRDLLGEAETFISERCAGLRFELGQVRSFRSLAMFYLGDVLEAGTRVLPILSDARERGDRYVESMLVNVTYRHHLLLDRAEAAREEVARGLSGWYTGRATVQDFYERAAQTRMALYGGEGTRAQALLEPSYRAMARSPLMKVQVIRVELWQLHAQAALLCAKNEGRAAERERWLKIAADEARRLADEPAGWSRPLAELIRAAVASQRGDRAEARGLLARAADRARAHGLGAYAAAAAFRSGQLGDAARADEAAPWLEAQRIASPERFANLFAPGF